MIHMFITLTFLLFNLCNDNSNNALKNNHKCIWFLSLIACIISDYRCFELFTRTKIEIINPNDKDKNEEKNKKGIKDNNNRDKKEKKNKYNFKIDKVINNLNITSNENDETNANLRTGIHNYSIIKEKSSSYRDYLNETNVLDNLNENNNNLNLEKNKKKEKNRVDEKNEKYLLVQEHIINKIIIILDILFVYLAFLIICLFIIYKYKKYSCLWFLSVYGVISSILNIIYYFRFKHIYIKEEKEIKAKQRKEIVYKKEIIYNYSPQKLSTNPQKNIDSSLGKFLDNKNMIKEVHSEEEISHQEKQFNINNFNSNIKNIENKTNIINKNDNKMIPMDMENEEDIIYNPYREDFIPESEVSKKTKDIKNKNNMNIPELKIKNINDKSSSEEYNILKSYRSFTSEENKLNSINSNNPINMKSEFDSKLFNNSGGKLKEEKLDEDEEDNTSVIHNPWRDDI